MAQSDAKEVSSQTLEEKGQALNRALNLFLSGKEAQALRELEASCVSAPGTADFDGEWADKLAFMTKLLQESERPDLATKLSPKAIRALEDVFSKTDGLTHKRRKIDALLQVSDLKYRIHGDVDGALDALDRASKADPEDKDLAEQRDRTKEKFKGQRKGKE